MPTIYGFKDQEHTHWVLNTNTMDTDIITRVTTSASAQPIAVRSTGNGDGSHGSEWLYFRVWGSARISPGSTRSLWRRPWSCLRTQDFPSPRIPSKVLVYSTSERWVSVSEGKSYHFQFDKSLVVILLRVDRNWLFYSKIILAARDYAQSRGYPVRASCPSHRGVEVEGSDCSHLFFYFLGFTFLN